MYFRSRNKTIGYCVAMSSLGKNIPQQYHKTSASVLSSFIGASLIRASQGSTNVNLISLQVRVVEPDI
jgi:H+/gluconate symporter-like permease